MKTYILIFDNGDRQTVEGYFDTVKEAKDYVKELELEDFVGEIHIYQLAENCYDLY